MRSNETVGEKNTEKWVPDCLDKCLRWGSNGGPQTKAVSGFYMLRIIFSVLTVHSGIIFASVITYEALKITHCLNQGSNNNGDSCAANDDSNTDNDDGNGKCVRLWGLLKPDSLLTAIGTAGAIVIAFTASIVGTAMNVTPYRRQIGLFGNIMSCIGLILCATLISPSQGTLVVSSVGLFLVVVFKDYIHMQVDSYGPELSNIPAEVGSAVSHGFGLSLVCNVLLIALWSVVGVVAPVGTNDYGFIVTVGSIGLLLLTAVVSYQRLPDVPAAAQFMTGTTIVGSTYSRLRALAVEVRSEYPDFGVLMVAGMIFDPALTTIFAAAVLVLVSKYHFTAQQTTWILGVGIVAAIPSVFLSRWMASTSLLSGLFGDTATILMPDVPSKYVLQQRGAGEAEAEGEPVNEAGGGGLGLGSVITSGILHRNPTSSSTSINYNSNPRDYLAAYAGTPAAGMSADCVTSANSSTGSIFGGPTGTNTGTNTGTGLGICNGGIAQGGGDIELSTNPSRQGIPLPTQYQEQQQKRRGSGSRSILVHPAPVSAPIPGSGSVSISAPKSSPPQTHVQPVSLVSDKLSQSQCHSQLLQVAPSLSLKFPPTLDASASCSGIGIAMGKHDAVSDAPPGTEPSTGCGPEVQADVNCVGGESGGVLVDADVSLTSVTCKIAGGSNKSTGSVRSTRSIRGTGLMSLWTSSAPKTFPSACDAASDGIAATASLDSAGSASPPGSWELQEGPPTAPPAPLAPSPPPPSQPLLPQLEEEKARLQLQLQQLTVPLFHIHRVRVLLVAGLGLILVNTLLFIHLLSPCDFGLACVLGAVFGFGLAFCWNCYNMLRIGMVPGGRESEFSGMYLSMFSAMIWLPLFVFSVANEVWNIDGAMYVLMIFIGIGGIVLLGVDIDRALAARKQSIGHRRWIAVRARENLGISGQLVDDALLENC
jgi:hypothetical protein